MEMRLLCSCGRQRIPKIMILAEEAVGGYIISRSRRPVMMDTGNLKTR